MYTNICRLMLFVFILNTLSYQTGFSQSLEERIEARVQDQVEFAKQDEDFHSSKMAELLEQYEKAETAAEVTAAVRALHAEQLRYQKAQDGYKQEQERLQKQQRGVLPEELVAKPDAIAQTVASYTQEIKMKEKEMEARIDRKENDAAVNGFLNKVRNGEIELDDLIEYLDPIDATGRKNVLLTAYAAEIIANTLDAIVASPDALSNIEDMDTFFGFILRIHARATHKLEVLGSGTNEDSVMAVGNLRILLYKIHKFYPKMGSLSSKFPQEDPFNSAKGDETYNLYPSQAMYNAYKNKILEDYNKCLAEQKRMQHSDGRQVTCFKPFIPSYKEFVAQSSITIYGIDKKAKDKKLSEIKKSLGANASKVDAYIKVETVQGAPKNVFKDFMASFMSEVRSENAKEDKSYLLSLRLQYAVRYAVISGQIDSVSKLVSMFEDEVGMRGWAYTDYDTENSPYLSTIFGVTYETLKGFALENSPTTWNDVVNLLKEKSSDGHAVNTRVLALEALSLLFAAAKDNNQSFIGNALQEKTYIQVNSSELSENLRDQIAKRVVDIYAPLQNIGSYGMRDYGLDSEQMVALSDQLASMYERFLPVMGPATVLENHYSNVNGVEKTKRYIADTKQRVKIDHIWDIGNIVYDSSISNPGAAFVYDSKGYAIDIHRGNYQNSKKVDEENMKLFFSIAGEALIWVYGGELFSLGFRAFGLARGAISALPRAVKAASVASKGHKWGRFTAKLGQGMRLSSTGMNATLEAASVKIAATTRTEQVVQGAVAGEKVNGMLQLTKTAGQTIGRKIYVKTPRSGTSYVFGETTQEGTTGLWERFWNKMTGNVPPVESYQIMARRPGFVWEQATVNFAGNLSNSSARLRFLRGVQNAGIDLTPMGWAGKQAVSFENTVLGATSQAFKMDATAAGLNAGKFDYWAYKAGKWERVSQQEFYEIGKTLESTKATASAAGVDISKDYYEILGVPRNASKQEIRMAYRNEVRKAHSDLFGGVGTPESEARIRLLNEANEVLLKDATKKAAYDAALGSAPVRVVESSSDGFALAITPKVGVEVPAGFNPITGSAVEGAEGSFGLGFTAENMSTDVSMQLTEHLLKTKQYDVLGDLLVSNTQFYQAISSNLKFFGVLAGLDYATYHLGMKPYMTSTAESVTQAEMAKYGDAYDPEKLEQDNAGNEIPAPTVGDAYKAVSEARKDDSAGALIVYPYLLAKQKLSEHGIGETPFMNDVTRGMLSTQAKRIQLYRALTEQQKKQVAKTEKDIQTYYQELIKSVADGKAQWQQELAQLKANQPELDLAKEEKALIQLFNAYDKDAKSIMNGSGDMMDKYKALSKLVERNQTKLQQCEEAVFAKIEESLYTNLVTNVQQAKIGWLQGLEASDAKEIEKLFDNALKDLKKIKGQKGSLEVKNGKYNAVMEKLSKGLESYQMTGAVPTQSSAVRAAQSIDDLMELHSFAQNFHGVEFGSQFMQELNDILRTSIAEGGKTTADGTIDPASLPKIIEVYNDKSAKLIEKYERANRTVYSEEDMDELLTDPE